LFEKLKSKEYCLFINQQCNFSASIAFVVWDTLITFVRHNLHNIRYFRMINKLKKSKQPVDLSDFVAVVAVTVSLSVVPEDKIIS